MDRFGPVVTAKEMLGERLSDLWAQVVAIWEAADGTLRPPQEFLPSIVRL